MGLYLWKVVLLALAPVIHEVGEPFFPLIHLLLAKGLLNNVSPSNMRQTISYVCQHVKDRLGSSYKGDSVVISRARVLKRDTMSLHIQEVLLGFL